MAAESVLVFDSCAIIALLYGEPGGEKVAALLEDRANRCRIHALNVCEVFYDGLRRDSLLEATALEDLLMKSGLTIEISMPLLSWQVAGELKAKLRRISLADCFALALALKEGGVLVTSDHREFDPVAAAEICPIHFIR